MKRKKLWAGLLLSALLLSGCAEAAAAQSQAQGTEQENATTIQFEGQTATASGSGASVQGSTVTITAAGRYVVAGSTEDGQIVVQAPETATVELVLNGAEIRSISTAAISCMQADALLVTVAEGTENTLADATEYHYEQVGADEPDAALFSKVDLTVQGSGSLLVEGNFNNGVGTKDDLILACEALTVTAKNDAVRGRDSVTVESGVYQLTAGGDGIQSNNDTAEDKGWIELKDGKVTIVAAYDGVQAETTLTVLGGSYTVTGGGGAANAAVKATQQAGGFGGGGQPPAGTAPPEAAVGDAVLPETATAETTSAATISAVAISPSAEGATRTTEEAVAAEAEAEAAEAEAEAAQTESDSHKGFKAGGTLTVSGGEFTLNTADDAFHSNGALLVSGGVFSITAGDDALHADTDLTVGGTAEVNILACYEGLEGQTVTVEGGVTNVVASDDGLNAASGTATQSAPGRGTEGCAINITGGVLRVNAGSQTGGDGLDSNGTLHITGGEVFVECGASAMDAALDCDGEVLIDGGSFFATGGLGMLSLPGEASAGASLLVSLDGLQGQGGTYTLKDMAGNTLQAQTVESAGACLLLSAPGLESGQTYTLEKDGEELFSVLLNGAVTMVTQTGSAASQAQVGAMAPGGGGGQRGVAPVASTAG